jgi:hypothetical protein
MALEKLRTNLPLPEEYLFLKCRMLKKQIQKEEEENIRHENNLVLNKLEKNIKNKGQYNPDFMKFFTF